MEESTLALVKKNIEDEPYARLFGIKIIDLKKGYSLVTMKSKKDYDNIFKITHGGAIFSLLDVAFGSAVNSYGTVAVALNISINYLKSACAGDILIAEAQEVSRSNKIASYSITVKNETSGEIIASAQTVAYLKNEKLPFL
ncbi:MAG TPA: hotdog fold thioesterase [Methanosarcinales archaeon]|nr:hotdog fold thioesterase [Methanosarcinales archaeon]